MSTCRYLFYYSGRFFTRASMKSAERYNVTSFDSKRIVGQYLVAGKS